jgi:hypothetical protein
VKLAVMVAVLAACGGTPKRDRLPPELAVPAGAMLVLTVDARGVQHYGCEAGVWTLVAPEATLFVAGHEVGTHGAGPTWTHADGSSVVGRKVAAATVDATAIPWFRLEATSHGTKPGVLADVTAIQRRDTTGGLAPTTACVDGATSDAPYTARYVFYR